MVANLIQALRIANGQCGVAAGQKKPVKTDSSQSSP
jgi:hypothetical protein